MCISTPILCMWADARAFMVLCKLLYAQNWGFQLRLPETIFVTLKIDAEFIETYTNDCSQEELVVGVNREGKKTAGWQYSPSRSNHSLQNWI